MNRTNTTIIAARAMAICITATLACNAADASPGNLDQSVAGGSLKYAVPFSDLDLSKSKVLLRYMPGFDTPPVRPATPS
jgi:hypothetical protein